jgi:choline dehydrogenase-like flavoprotein
MVWNRGEVLGGSTAINFMVFEVRTLILLFAITPTLNHVSFMWQRPSSAEIDGSIYLCFLTLSYSFHLYLDVAIASMGNPGSEWDNLFKYIKKAERYAVFNPTYFAFMVPYVV